VLIYVNWIDYVVINNMNLLKLQSLSPIMIAININSFTFKCYQFNMWTIFKTKYKVSTKISVYANTCG